MAAPKSRRESILSCEDLPTVTVDVPEWKTKIDMACLPAADFARWQNKHMNMEDDPAADAGAESIKSMCDLIVATARDDDGRALFDPGDVDALTRKNARVLTRLFRAALDVNAVSDEANEGLEKN